MDDNAGLRLGTYYRVHLLRRLGFADEHGLILDIGGRDGRWLGTLEGVRVLADVDPVPALDGVRYVQASGDALPLRDGAADAVFSLDVIEHVPDEAALIEEALRVLRPGGRLVLTTPSVHIRVFPSVLQSWIDRKWGHHRVRGFDADHLERLLDKNEVADAHVRPLALRAFRLAYFPMRILWALPGGIGRAVVRLAARMDARFPWGEHGALLVDARR